MKKQTLILATLFVITVFISCSKEITKQDEPQAEEFATSRSGDTRGGSTNSLSKGLLGLYEFNGSLIEKTGKLATAQTSNEGPATYTVDRKGFRGRAVKFTGAYALDLGYVPHSAKMSLAVWVKYDDALAKPSNFIHSQSDGPRVQQVADAYYGYNNPSGPPYIASSPINNDWHFLALTLDGTTIRFYVDGNFAGSAISPDVENIASAIYTLGYGNIAGTYWLGAIDDLRLYGRTLSSSEVLALYSL